MTKDELMKYCEPSNEKIAQPFSYAQYTYASNGHMLIRITRMFDIPVRGNAPSLDGINKHFYSIVQREHQPIPDFPPPKKIYCNECGGKGKDYTCPECAGIGVVEWDTDYHSYNCKCKNCLGEGIIDDVCPQCNGVGYFFKQEPFPIGTQHYDKRYLAIIRDLPGSAFAPGNNIKELGHFTFAEGDGLLMPMIV